MKFEIVYEDDDLIKVHVSCSNGVFCGAAHVYLGKGKVQEIAARLQGFPSRPSDTREVLLGAFGPESAGGGVNMWFHCADGAGHAYAEIRIESVHDSAGTVQSAILSLPIEAAAVDSFVDELRRVDVGIAATARLKGALALP